MYLYDRYSEVGLPGSSGPGVGSRLALIAADEGNGQLGQDESPDSQLDDSTEFLGLNVGALGNVAKDNTRMGALLESRFTMGNRWRGLPTHEEGNLRDGKETTRPSRVPCLLGVRQHGKTAVFSRGWLRGGEGRPFP